MRETGAAQLGHRLVLVRCMTTSAFAVFKGRTVQRWWGPLLLGWINEQLGVKGVISFSGGGWGDDQVDLVDVSDRL